MTKQEEILSNIIKNAYKEYWGEELIGDPFNDIRKFAAIEAMDEYAKINSVKYVKWLFDTDCIGQSIGGSMGLNGSFDIEKTANELYDNFLEKTN